MSQSTRIIDIRNAGLNLNSTTRELTRREELQKRYTSGWTWRALAALIDVDPEAARSLKWLAHKLSIGLEQVVEGLEGLEELGIIERTAQGYKKILKYVYFSDRDLNPQDVLSDHVMVSSQILNRLDPRDPNKKSFYRTGFVASNEALVRDFCLKLEVLMKEFIESSAKSQADRVVAFSFSNVKITNDE